MSFAFWFHISYNCFDKNESLTCHLGSVVKHDLCVLLTACSVHIVCCFRIERRTEIREITNRNRAATNMSVSGGFIKIQTDGEYRLVQVKPKKYHM